MERTACLCVVMHTLLGAVQGWPWHMRHLLSKRFYTAALALLPAAGESL